MTAGTAADLYLRTYRRRVQSAPGYAPVEAPGLVGAVADGGRRVALLVLDDSAVAHLDALLRARSSGVILVATAATEATRWLSSRRGWTGSALEAMACQDLAQVPAPEIGHGLSVEEIALEGAILTATTELVARADPDLDLTPERLADHLATMRPRPRVFVAIDPSGAVRATSGCRIQETTAMILLVNTDPELRGAGIGTAMTARALHAAREGGAETASLQATAAGAGVYRRLGFESAGTITQFSRML